MWGRRILQMKQAMKQILPQLLKNDLFDIIEFDSSVYVYQFDQPVNSFLKKVIDEETPLSHYGSLNEIYLRNISLFHSKATPENIKKAFQAIEQMEPKKGTNSLGGLEVALSLVKSVQNENPEYVPIIVFLTDGQPTTGITTFQEIIEKATYINNHQFNASIYSISFGVEVDWNFLRSLSWNNRGRTIRIEIARDADEQLLNFYQQILMPLLREVQFMNLPETKDATKSSFPLFFNGSELIVAGKGSIGDKSVWVSSKGVAGRLDYQMTKMKGATNLELIWVILRITQLIEKFYATNEEIFFRNACDLTVQHSFLTGCSSLIVLLPKNMEILVNVEDGGFQNPARPGKTPIHCFNLEAYFHDLYPHVTRKTKATKTPEKVESHTTEEYVSNTIETEDSQITTTMQSTLSSIQKTLFEESGITNGEEFGSTTIDDLETTNEQYVTIPTADSETTVTTEESSDEFETTTQHEPDIITIKQWENFLINIGLTAIDDLETTNEQYVTIPMTDSETTVTTEESSDEFETTTQHEPDPITVKECEEYNENTIDECYSNEEWQNVTLNRYLYPNRNKVAENCILRPALRTCEFSSKKWFFNLLRGRCTAFDYCSCEGNGYYFSSKEACEDNCVNVEDPCKLPISLGSCTNYTLQWFYSQRINKCIQYEYGGCNGNGNRFDTKEECSKCIV